MASLSRPKFSYFSCLKFSSIKMLRLRTACAPLFANKIESLLLNRHASYADLLLLNPRKFLTQALHVSCAGITSQESSRQSVDQSSPTHHQQTPHSARSTDSSIASTVVPRSQASGSLPQTPISLGGSSPLGVSPICTQLYMHIIPQLKNSVSSLWAHYWRQGYPIIIETFHLSKVHFCNSDKIWLQRSRASASSTDIKTLDASSRIQSDDHDTNGWPDSPTSSKSRGARHSMERVQLQVSFQDSIG